MKTVGRVTVGYGKRLAGKVCEDAKGIFRYADYTVLVVADGHGDKKCRFASVGSVLAAQAVKSALNLLKKECPHSDRICTFLNENREKLFHTVVICWIKAVLEDYIARTADKRFEAEKERLFSYLDHAFSPRKGCFSPDEIRQIAEERKRCEDGIYAVTVLYGTTLKAAVVSDEAVFCFGIGDGDVVAVGEEKVEWCLPRSEQFSTETRSLCCRFENVDRFFSARLMRRINKSAQKDFTEETFDFRMLFVSTDGLRNSFSDDESFCRKLREIADVCGKKGVEYFSKKSQRWIENLTKNSVFRDDIAFVCAMNE